MPFGNVLGPLVVWMIKKDQSEFVATQAKEALNFQITMILAAIVSAVLILVFIGILLLPVVVIAQLVLMIIAAVQAKGGEDYRYPFTMRLVA